MKSAIDRPSNEASRSAAIFQPARPARARCCREVGFAETASASVNTRRKLGRSWVRLDPRAFHARCARLVERRPPRGYNTCHGHQEASEGLLMLLLHNG